MNGVQRTLGIDIGGTKIAIGLVGRGGEIEDCARYASDASSPESIARSLEAALEAHRKQAGFADADAAVISLVGRVDSKAGKWVELIPGIPGTAAVREAVERITGLPVFMGNDVYVATLAERYWGVGRQTGDFVYLNIGTGIAGRVVFQGRVLRGAHWDAGEVGHMTVGVGSDVPCICGRTGCVEAFASGLGMSNEAHRLYGICDTSLSVVEGERVAASDLFEAWRAGDPLGSRIVEQAAQGIAALISNLARVSDPDCVVLGGGLANDDAFVSRIRELADAPSVRNLNLGIRRTDLDCNVVSLMGCAALRRLMEEE